MMASLPERFITEEELEKYESRESTLQEQKDQANMEAEKAKTALEVLEKQLQVDGMTCLRRAGTEHHPEIESLDELLVCLQEAYKTLLYEKKANQERLLILQADCMALKKAEKDLAKAEDHKKKSYADCRGKKIPRCSQKEKYKSHRNQCRQHTPQEYI